jgi:uncharacterized ion transporter superfamily protein YfcC
MSFLLFDEHILSLEYPFEKYLYLSMLWALYLVVLFQTRMGAASIAIAIAVGIVVVATRRATREELAGGFSVSSSTLESAALLKNIATSVNYIIHATMIFKNENCDFQ